MLKQIILERVMKILVSLLTLAGMVVASQAQSAITYGAVDAGNMYAGVKVGQVNANLGDEKTLGYGVYGGYHFDQNFGAELEYTTAKEKSHFVDGQERVYDTSGYGAYGTYRYHFNSSPFYAKGKVGIAKTDLDDTATNGSYVGKIDKLGLGYGVGAGYQNGSLGIEATYSKASEIGTVAVGAHLFF